MRDHPEEQLLEVIRRGAIPGEVESYLNLTLRKISDGELAGASLDEQGNEGDKRRALARARVYDKALGEAKDGTPIEKFLVTKLRTDESLQRGGHCEMVDCSAARWNMVNIVLASIRWRDAAENGRVSGNEELLAIAAEYGHVRLVEQLTQMRDHPEEQLLEAIRRGATPGEVESYLNLTLRKISDGELGGASLDEQGNEGDKRRALARARVYDKALGEAEDGTPIEKFLVTKLRTDESLQRGGHCEMVDCSAARWNMVNIVLAWIRWRDAAENGRVSGNEELLAIAVEYGHVKLVLHLTEMQDVDVNISSNPTWFVVLSLPSQEPNNARLTDQESMISKNHFDFLEPIGSAARMGNVDMVRSLLACDRIDINKGDPLHWAAAMGHLDVVKELLKSKKVDVNALKSIPVKDKHGTFRYGMMFSPLRLASVFGHASVVKALCEDTRANTVNWWGAFQIATEQENHEIVLTLLKRPEFAKQVESLYRDRQVHVDAANAILVGAALIGSVTFAAWLQPPLGYSAFFGSASIEVGAPSPSGIYPSFVSVAGHPIMQIFWVFNSMSFFFAIATLMVGARAARPPKRGIFIGEVVRSLRASLSLAYKLLTISVGCVMGAFASAGFLVLPPIPKYMFNMGVTVGIGVTVVFYPSIVLYVLKVMIKILGWIVEWLVDWIEKIRLYFE
jgi:ankyrin repeat protein